MVRREKRSEFIHIKVAGVPRKTLRVFPTMKAALKVEANGLALDRWLVAKARWLMASFNEMFKWDDCVHFAVVPLEQDTLEKFRFAIIRQYEAYRPPPPSQAEILERLARFHEAMRAQRTAMH